MTNFDAVPTELKKLSQWVCWRYETRDGKKTKVPYTPSGSHAQSDNAKTWSAFADCVKAATRFDGIGVMFGNELAGTDLDHCIDDGGQIADWAQPVIETMDTYTEFSPSGSGLHLLFFGKLPAGGRRKGQIEMYDAGRFFTVTGNHLPNTPTTIEKRSEQAARVHAEYIANAVRVDTVKSAPVAVHLDDTAIIEKASAAKNGDAFAALWRGDTSAHDGDASAADLALSSHLAFWCDGDDARIDRLFRQSGLMRDKWDKRHSSDGSTYGQMTIAKAIAGAREFYTTKNNGNGNAGQIEIPARVALIADDSLCPTLPESARLDADLGLDACQWLDDYIAFSRKWSPRSFDGFHEACGLWLLSTIAARRVVLNFGKPYHTPLYIALTARTSLYAKSTVGDIATQTLRAAGLDWLLTPDDSTPQAFVRGLSRRVPDGFDDLSNAEQARIKNQLALAGQRGWFYEEFGQHIAAMMRDGGVMADFRGLLRRFDDCKEGYATETIGRGSVKVERPYLSLLALLTPADLAPFARRGAALWGDGFLARFALITPDSANDNRARFPEGERIIPAKLLDPLWQWHSRLGMPTIEIEDITNDEGKPTGRKRAVVNEHTPQVCTMGKGIADAFYGYHDGLLDLVRESERTELDGNYSRFAEKAMRIAILLASLENNNRIEMRHWARAHEITERWRDNLHSMFEQVTASDGPGYKRTQEDRVIKCLRKHSPASAFEIGRYTGLSTDEVETILKSLIKAGAVTPIQTSKTTKYQL